MEHLEGITILNEYMTYAPAVWATIVFISCILFFVLWGICLCSDHGELAYVFAVLAIAAFIGGIIGMLAFPIEDGMVYECLVDDSITYKELVNTYEIIEQRGDIYNLKFLE